MEPPIYLSVVIPAYNEESRLPGTLESILGYLERQPYASEVILVDDGSTDGTVQFVESVRSDTRVPLRILKSVGNRGKGFSVRRGLLAAKGKVRLFTDADLSTPITEFEKMKDLIDGGADVVIGSRGMADSQVEVHQAWYRETMGKTFNLLVRLIAVGGIHDTQCGFKVFTARFVEHVCPHLQIDGWAFDVEMLYLARARGYKIEEVPVRWRNNDNTRVNALLDSSKMFIELLRIRWMALRGKYRSLSIAG
jgi:dolichyl-phosphate beta-glucosyltransferase